MTINPSNLLVRFLPVLVAAALIVAGVDTTARAQDVTQSARGTPGPTADPFPTLSPDADALRKLVDYRGEMRKLIQKIATYARQHRPGFVVIPHNGLDLVEKQDEVDEKKRYPARAYMLTINGVMQDGIFYGGGEQYGAPTPKERQDRLFFLTDLAKRNGLRVFSMDYARERKTVDEILRLNRKRGFIPYPSHAEHTSELNSLPTYPARPFRENPDNVLSLDKVKNFLYLADSTPFGLPVEFALKLHDTNFDVVVVDVFHGLKPLSRRAVETMKYKKLGARRMVFARLDVGTAANYRYYWKESWFNRPPRWIAGPYPTDPDRFFVEYWQPQWHKALYGDAQSFMFGIIAQGYDGVVLEGVEAYRYFESDGEDIQGFK